MNTHYIPEALIDALSDLALTQNRLVEEHDYGEGEVKTQWTLRKFETGNTGFGELREQWGLVKVIHRTTTSKLGQRTIHAPELDKESVVWIPTAMSRMIDSLISEHVKAKQEEIRRAIGLR